MWQGLRRRESAASQTATKLLLSRYGLLVCMKVGHRVIHWPGELSGETDTWRPVSLRLWRSVGWTLRAHEKISGCLRQLSSFSARVRSWLQAPHIVYICDLGLSLRLHRGNDTLSNDFLDYCLLFLNARLGLEEGRCRRSLLSDEILGAFRNTCGRTRLLWLEDQTAVHGRLTLFLWATEGSLSDPWLWWWLCNTTQAPFLLSGRATPTTWIRLERLAILTGHLQRSILTTKRWVYFSSCILEKCSIVASYFLFRAILTLWTTTMWRKHALRQFFVSRITSSFTM